MVSFRMCQAQNMTNKSPRIQPKQEVLPASTSTKRKAASNSTNEKSSRRR